MAAMGRIAALAAAALLFSGVACAADEATYLYGAVGATRIDPGVNQAASDAALQSLGAPDVDSKLDRWDSGWKILVGWMPSRHVAVEGGFAVLGTATYSAQFTGGTAKTQFRGGGIVFDALGLLPVSDSLSLFAKVGGILASVVTTQNVAAPGNNAGAAPSGNASTITTTTARMLRPNFGAGAMLDVTKNLSLRFEVERFSNVGSESTGGASNIDMISLGLLLKL